MIALISMDALSDEEELFMCRYGHDLDDDLKFQHPMFLYMHACVILLYINTHLQLISYYKVRDISGTLFHKFKIIEMPTYILHCSCEDGRM